MVLIFLGIMVGQFLYMCTLWWQHKRKEYAYYVVHYIIFAYFLFGLSYEYYFPPAYIQANEKWFSLLQFQPLHIFNYYLYIKFAQYFLETKKLYPPQNSKAVIMMKGVWICTAIGIICWLIFGPTNKTFESIYLVLSIFLMIWAIRLVYLIYTMKTKQSAYIFKGSLLLSIGILVTYVLLTLEQSGMVPRDIGIFYPSIFGVLGEIYFVNAGLNYKASSKRKELIHTQQQLIQELERNKMLHHKKDSVRNDLSLQLNKEIGLTLDGIGLFAEHSSQKLQKGDIPEVEKILQRIVEDSNKMVSSMSDIVWILTSENDMINKTLARLRFYAVGVCKEKHIVLDFTGQAENNSLMLDMQQRKDLYSLYKKNLDEFVTGGAGKLSVNVTVNDKNLRVELVKEEDESDSLSEGGNGIGPAQKVANRYSFIFQTHPSG